MRVISNTSPIINLAAIGQLGLLRDLFGEVVIPQAVFDEIVIRGEGKPGALEVAARTWFHIETVQDQALVQALLGDLHAGEAEALALAVESKPDVVLLDERRARETAQRFGLPYTGLLGVLEQAKREGLVPVIRPLLDDLQHKAGFWINTALYTHILRRVGE